MGPKPQTKTHGRCKVITQMPTYAYDQEHAEMEAKV